MVVRYSRFPSLIDACSEKFVSTQNSIPSMNGQIKAVHVFSTPMTIHSSVLKTSSCTDVKRTNSFSAESFTLHTIL